MNLVKYPTIKQIAMKTATLLFLLGLFYLPVAAQAPQVIYSYDDGGNRVQRRIIMIGERWADTTATEEIEEPPIEDGMVLAYPNPTDGNLTVSISPNLLEDEENARYLVVDLSGKEIRKGSLVQSITTLDLTGEASGNYILTVFVGERREDWQLVKN